MTGPMIFPKSKTLECQREYDWLSSILFLASILPFVHGLKELVSTETKLSGALSLSWGLVVGAVFVMRQLKCQLRAKKANKYLISANPIDKLHLFSTQNGILIV